MTAQEHAERRADIRDREQWLSKRIDDLLNEGIHPDTPVLRPLIHRHQQIIEELRALDREFIRHL